VPGDAVQCTADRYYDVGDIPPEVVALKPVLGPDFGNGIPLLHDNLFFASLKTDYRPTNSISLTSVTGFYRESYYMYDDFMGVEQAVLDSSQTTLYNQFTEEVRATTSFDSPINFMFGAFFGRTWIHAPVNVTFAPPLVPEVTLIDSADYRHQTNSYSVFGQAIYDFAPGWEFTAGARWTHDWKSQNGSLRGPSSFSGCTTVLSDCPILPLTFAVNEVDFYNLSPEFTLTYKPSDDLTLYATMRDGFESGGFNQNSFLATGSDNSFKPETARGGEIGAKGLALDHQLEFHTGAYYYKYNSLQLSSYDSSSGSFKIQNAGKATIYGVEISGLYAPADIPGLSLRGAVNYNHARYDEFPATCYPGQTIALGCNEVLVGGVYQAQSLAGQPLVRSMDWSSNVGATYETTIMEGLGLSATMEGNYTGPYYAMLEEAPKSYQEGVWKINANLTLSGDNDNWELSLIGTNLTNELTYALVQGTPLTGFGQGTDGPAQLSDLSAVLGDPRTVMLRITLRNGLIFH
jgi:iron complex outermembrane receptor protein